MRGGPDELHARAGLVASEWSLVGLGTATLGCAALVAVLRGVDASPLVRPAVASGAGLVTAGIAVAAFGRLLDFGATRRRSERPGATRPLSEGPTATHPHPEGLGGVRPPVSFQTFAGFAVALAAGAWVSLLLLSAHESTFGSRYAAGDLLFAYGPGLAVLAAAVVLAGVPTLALLCLRTLGAWDRAVPMPLGQIFQASGHALLGGIGLLLLIGASADALGGNFGVALRSAAVVLCGHVALWATWLVAGARRRLSVVRAAGLRVPVLERGYLIATIALMGGLLLPGLVLLANLTTGNDMGTLVSCSVIILAGHATRYAWVLLQFGAIDLQADRTAN
ncbi:MAG: hypothetical protein EXR79_05740 [Myxococcales bacterium]|nr:hypothetical protein [Myxococcales bacterium]